MNILTKEAVNHLLTTYAEVGGDAARALAPRYGIKPTYVRQLAVAHKVKVKRKDPSPKKLRGARDPRWQRAIERGSVIV